MNIVCMTYSEVEIRSQFFVRRLQECWLKDDFDKALTMIHTAMLFAEDREVISDLVMLSNVARRHNCMKDESYLTFRRAL